MQKVLFQGEFLLPDGADAADCVEYIVSALKSECGARMPEDPMSEFNRSSIHVKVRIQNV